MDTNKLSISNEQLEKLLDVVYQTQISDGEIGLDAEKKICRAIDEVTERIPETESKVIEGIISAVYCDIARQISIESMRKLIMILNGSEPISI